MSTIKAAELEAVGSAVCARKVHTVTHREWARDATGREHCACKHSVIVPRSKEAQFRESFRSGVSGVPDVCCSVAVAVVLRSR